MLAGAEVAAMAAARCAAGADRGRFRIELRRAVRLLVGQRPCGGVGIQTNGFGDNACQVFAKRRLAFAWKLYRESIARRHHGGGERFVGQPRLGHDSVLYLGNALREQGCDRCSLSLERLPDRAVLALWRRAMAAAHYLVDRQCAAANAAPSACESGFRYGQSHAIIVTLARWGGNVARTAWSPRAFD
jgi:hypothetical protein